MLVKDFTYDYTPGKVGKPYRPYSRTCPPAAPSLPSTEVCGTYTVSTFIATDLYGKDVVVVETSYNVAGVTIPTTTDPKYDPSKPHTDPQIVHTGTCCVQVAG